MLHVSCPMFDQILKKSSLLLDKSASVLIIPDQMPSKETLGSTFALALFLEAKNKKTGILISSDLGNNNLLNDNFFKKPSSIISEIFDPRAFIIKINTKSKPATQLKYETEKNFLKIIIDSEKENFSREDVSFEYTPFTYDLIITIGINDIKNLNEIFEKNKDFFRQTPIININNRAPAQIRQNEYQQTNIINQGLSKGEIIYLLLKQLDKSIIDKNIANWLAFSLIESPASSSENILSELFTLGAQKEKILEYGQTKEGDDIFNATAKIFHLKDILKIKNNLFVKIPNDFFKEEVTKITLLSLAKELSLSFLKTENIFLILEKNKEFIVAAYINNNDNIKKIQDKITGSVYENCIFSKIKASGIDEAEKKIITLLDISW